MDLFEAVCLTLWWAEGSKIRKSKRWGSFLYSVEITNTDPLIITTFLKYLRTKLNVQNHRFKVQLQIHEGDNKKDLENFWSLVTELPLSQFNKTIIRPIGNKVGKTKGTCKLRIHDKVLCLELLKRLDNLRGVVHR